MPTEGIESDIFSDIKKMIMKIQDPTYFENYLEFLAFH